MKWMDKFVDDLHEKKENVNTTNTWEQPDYNSNDDWSIVDKPTEQSDVIDKVESTENNDTTNNVNTNLETDTTVTEESINDDKWIPTVDKTLLDVESDIDNLLWSLSQINNKENDDTEINKQDDKKSEEIKKEVELDKNTDLNNMKLKYQESLQLNAEKEQTIRDLKFKNNFLEQALEKTKTSLNWYLEDKRNLEREIQKKQSEAISDWLTSFNNLYKLYEESEWQSSFEYNKRRALWEVVKLAEKISWWIDLTPFVMKVLNKDVEITKEAWSWIEHKSEEESNKENVMMNNFI